MPTKDINTRYGPSSAPLADYVPITAGAGDLADGPCRAILVTVAGTVNLTTADDVNRDGIHLAAGIWHPIVAKKIRAGGTATGIIAGY